MPVLWPAIARTSHSGQTVGFAQSSGASERSWPATLSYSVLANPSTSARVIGGIVSTCVESSSCSPSLRRLLRLLGDVLVEHLDCVVDQPDPAIAAGIVGQLLVGQTRTERGEQVEGFWFAHTASCEQLAELREVVLGDLERLR